MTEQLAVPHLWMDVTTSARGRGSHATGTLRIERQLAAALAQSFGSQLRFCRYDPLRQSFVETPPPQPHPATAAAPGQPRRGPGARDSRSESLGKRLERMVRLQAKEALKRVHQWRSKADPTTTFPAAKRGDVLLLGGETWGERYDFDVLARIRRERGVRLAAICQDLIPLTHPQFFESACFIERYRDYVSFLLANADLLLVFSNDVDAELRRASKQSVPLAGRVARITLGSDLTPVSDPRPPQTEQPLQPGGFVLSVSTIQSRKNFDLLYRLWRRFAEAGRDVPRLVIVGQRGFGSSDLLWQIEHDPLLARSVVLLHRVSDGELAWLYENCAFTLYPSFVEGWGLPVAESLAYGKLCIASNASAIPEPGAGLAVHLDPNDFMAWHEAVLRFAGDENARRELEHKIRSDYRRLTWADTARGLTDELRKMLGEAATATPER
jgi:glycosyltransferase involved in cell wall biosynthesis